MIISFFKLAVNWIFHHKLRYLFGWASFGLISLLLVFGFSFGEGSLLNSNNSNYYCISIKGTSKLNESFSELVNKIDAKSYRMVSDTGFEIDSIDGDSVDKYIGEVDFFEGELLLGVGEKTLITKELSEKTYDIYISSELAKEYENNIEDLIGKIIAFKNIEQKYVIKGIFNDDYGFSNDVIAYIPYMNMLGECPTYGIKRIDFEFTDEKSTRNAINYLGDKYELVGDSSDLLYKIQLVSAYKRIAIALSALLFIIAGIGMYNISSTTLNENSDFLYLLRVLGIRKYQYHTLIDFLTVIQGIVGAIIGLILSYILKGTFPVILRYTMGDYYNDLQMDFNISTYSILIVFFYNILVSIIIGEILARIRDKKDYEIIGR